MLGNLKKDICAERGFTIYQSECKKLLKELRELPVAASHHRYSPKEVIYNQYSSEKNALYVLLDGVVKLDIPYQRDKNFVRLVGPWEIFGDVRLLDKRSSRVWAEAFTACKITKIPRSSLLQAIRWHPEVTLKLATLREFQLVEHEVLLECLWHRRTKTRLARLLLVLANRFNENSKLKAPIQINLKLSYQELAEMIAATRESVYNIVKELRYRKLIEMSEQQVIILDYRGLKECALLSSLTSI